MLGDSFCWPYPWLSGKLWYLQHNCVGDTIVYHSASDSLILCFPTAKYLFSGKAKKGRCIWYQGQSLGSVFLYLPPEKSRNLNSTWAIFMNSLLVIDGFVRKEIQLQCTSNDVTLFFTNPLILSASCILSYKPFYYEHIFFLFKSIYEDFHFQNVIWILIYMLHPSISICLNSICKPKYYIIYIFFLYKYKPYKLFHGLQFR